MEMLKCVITLQEISLASEEMFVLLYVAKMTNELLLSDHRNLALLPTTKEFKTDLISPPSRSAQQHSFRFFLLIRVDCKSLPEHWGWTRGEEGSLIPTKTL